MTRHNQTLCCFESFGRLLDAVGEAAAFQLRVLAGGISKLVCACTCASCSM